MERLFAWYYVIFWVPLLIGMVLALSASFGVDSDADADVDVDVDAEADASVVIKALSIIGVGKCPLSIIVISMLVLWGVTGLVVNTIVPLPYLILVSLGAAFASMLFFTRLIATIVSKIMPGTETYAVSPDHLIGLTGKIVVAASKESFGKMDLTDHNGDLQRVKCRTYSGKFPTGTKVLITERVGDTFIVDKDPQI